MKTLLLVTGCVARCRWLCVDGTRASTGPVGVAGTGSTRTLDQPRRAGRIDQRSGGQRGHGKRATGGAPSPAGDIVQTPVATTTTTPTASAGERETTSPSTGAAIADALSLPVQGIIRNDLQDTFTDPRSEGRVHDAIDIMATAGTPVLAVADGTVGKLLNSKRGGLTIYQFEPSGRYAYYYAHLQRYADGLAEKQTIRRGQVIGYVGSTGTGNASADAPHLHFAIFRLGPDRHWWEGQALNPYPVLHDNQPL